MEALLLVLDHSYVGMFFFPYPKHAQDTKAIMLLIFTCKDQLPQVLKWNMDLGSEKKGP